MITQFNMVVQKPLEAGSSCFEHLWVSMTSGANLISCTFWCYERPPSHVGGQDGIINWCHGVFLLSLFTIVHWYSVSYLFFLLTQVCSVCLRVWSFTGTSSSSRISGLGRAARETPSVSPSCAPSNSVYWPQEWAASLSSVSIVHSEGQSSTPPSLVNQCARV